MEELAVTLSMKKMECLVMLNDLQASIEHEEETEECLENEMTFNIGEDIEQETTNIFKELLNEAHSELYPGCSKFSSLEFFG